MLGLKAPSKDEHGDFLFLLQMNTYTVIFLHLSGLFGGIVFIRH